MGFPPLDEASRVQSSWVPTAPFDTSGMLAMGAPVTLTATVAYGAPTARCVLRACVSGHSAVS